MDNHLLNESVQRHEEELETRLLFGTPVPPGKIELQAELSRAVTDCLNRGGIGQQVRRAGEVMDILGVAAFEAPLGHIRAAIAKLNAL